MNKYIPWVVVSGAALIFAGGYLFFKAQNAIPPSAVVVDNFEKVTSVPRESAAIAAQQECRIFGVSSDARDVQISKECDASNTEIKPLYLYENGDVFKIYDQLFTQASSTTKVFVAHIADLNNLRILWADEESRYVLINQDVYLNEVKLGGIDAASFQLVGKDRFPKGPYSGDNILHYTKDKNSVFYDGVAILNADTKSFEYIPAGTAPSEQEYAKDVHRVYYKNEVIPNAEPHTFVLLDSTSNGWRVFGPYSRDANHVFYQTREIKNVDLKTFSALYEDEYASDKDHVYLKGNILLGADPKIFLFPIHEPG